MNRRCRMAFLLVSVSFAYTVKAAEAPSTPESVQLIEGHQAYEKGRWDDALAAYAGLVAKGFQSPALYYDLGNVYYRKGERGKAVLWYERAAHLSPRDPDIRFNLALARAHLKEGPGSILRRLVLSVSRRELLWTSTIFSWVLFGLGGATLLGWMRPSLWRTSTMVLAALLWALSLVWVGVHLSLTDRRTAVVVSPPGEVRNGPGQDYGVGFTIPEGSRVLILERRPDWVQIGALQQGLKGWMPSTDVERIEF